MFWYEITPYKYTPKRDKKLYCWMNDFPEYDAVYAGLPEDIKKKFEDVGSVVRVYGNPARFEKDIETHLKEEGSKLKLEDIRRRGWICFSRNKIKHQ